MAQKHIAFRLLTGALKTRGLHSRRQLHDGAVSGKKGLHNAESVVGLVADSMGRSRVKLTGEFDRNGMARVGPTADILQQVPRAAGEAAAAPEPKIEQKGEFVMADPNSSMWSMCKRNKEEGAAIKLSTRFKKMKDTIKQYYLERVEENQIMLAEVEEPFKIGKLDKRDRQAKYKDMREEEMETMDEPMVMAVPYQRPGRRLQKNVAVDAVEDNYLEMKSGESQNRYRKFNRQEYKTVAEEDSRPRMRSAEEKVYIEPERSIANVWKRQHIKADKDIKDAREGCYSDMTGTLSPSIHFKCSTVGIRNKGLLNGIKSGDAMGFFKNKFSDRQYSTMYNVRVPLILQRELASQCVNTGGVVNNTFVKAHSLSTCTNFYNSSDKCRPPPLPPKVCDPDEKLPKCPKPPAPEWPCCPKITLCGCEPPNPRLLKPACGLGDFKASMSLAKRPEYVCPSFSECQRRAEMIKKRATECCVRAKTCDNFVGPSKPFVSAMERQELSLGQKYWTGQKQQCCSFHSGSPLMQEDAGDEGCSGKKDKAQLPCQKTVNIPGVRKKEKYQGKGTCEKLCMPCCEPARDPPECLSIYEKPPCTKFRNPRPSFSECRKMFPFKHSMCECEVPKKPICEKKKKDDSTCA